MNPDTYFDELPMVMKQVPQLPGEEAIYNWIGSILTAAANDQEIKKTLKENAAAAEREAASQLLVLHSKKWHNCLWT